VRKEREIQNAVVYAIKKDERARKLAQDDLLVQQAADSMEQEKQAALNKKNEQRGAMVKLMDEWAEDKKSHLGDRKKRETEEKIKVAEFMAMVDAQEARNKQNIPPARMPRGEYAPPDKAARRKQERALEDEMMKLVRTANIKAAEAEVKKKDEKIQERQSNQDFLFQQMMERKNKKDEAFDEGKKLMVTIQAEAAEFGQSEKDRIETKRLKNIQHRIELEKQIENKKPPARFQRRHAEDVMTAAEVAMNRHLLEEARSMRSTVESQARSTF